MNSPKIRFKNFNYEWKDAKLSQFLDVSKEKNINDIYGKEDVLSVSGEFGIVNQIKFQGRSFAGKSVSNYGIVNKGDIVYTKSPLKEAPYGIIKENKGEPGIVSVLYGVFHPKNNSDSCFIQTYFDQRQRLNNYLRPLVNKGAKNTLLISDENSLNGNVSFPEKEEQQKIGKLLQHLDELIEKQQLRINKTKQLKQTMLEKLFPKEGEKIPKMRFKEFEGEWSEKKLGEISESFSGGTPQANNVSYYGGDIPFIRSGEIHNNKTELFLTKSGLENSSAKLVSKGTILYALYGATSGEVDISKIDGAINQAILAIKPNEKYFSKFIVERLRKEKSSITGTYLQGGQGNLSGDIVKKLELKFPSLYEQEKIGSFCEKLDEQIMNNEQKLEKLKNIKQSLLQKMFI